MQIQELERRDRKLLPIYDFTQKLLVEQVALGGKAYSQAYRNEKLVQKVLRGYWKFADMQPAYWRIVLGGLEEIRELQNREALANFLTRLGERTSWLTRHTEMHCGEVQQAVNLSYQVSKMKPPLVRVVPTDFSSADRMTGELISNGELIMKKKLGGTGALVANALARSKIEEALGCQIGNISPLVEINARIAGNVASIIEKPLRPYIVTPEGKIVPREPEPDDLQLIDILDKGYPIAGEVHRNSAGRSNGSETAEYLVFDLRPGNLR